jgi:8-oxo-dGTP diphosphatase
MTKYSLGFIFNTFEDEVLLINYNKPGKWHDKKFNGIGGKVEEGENIEQSMSRECLEETGLELSGCWYKIGEFSGKEPFNKEISFVVEVFAVVVDFNMYEQAKRFKSDEGTLAWHSIYNLPEHLLPNATWLIPLCKDYLGREGDGLSFNVQYL